MVGPVAPARKVVRKNPDGTSATNAPRNLPVDFVAQMRESFADPTPLRGASAHAANLKKPSSASHAFREDAKAPREVLAERKAKQRAAEAAKPRTTLLATDLPGSIEAVYQQTIEHMVPHLVAEAKNLAKKAEPAARQQAADRQRKVADEKPAAAPVPTTTSVFRPYVIEEVGGATLALTVPSKAFAKRLFSRLQNANVYGRRWKVEFVPKSATVAANLPSVVDIRLSAPLTLGHVHHVLAALPGFLTVFEELDSETIIGAKAPTSTAADVESDELAAPTFTNFVATFADEGSALHVRAVVSGRQYEGAHFFVTRRPVVQPVMDEEDA